jgi:hypothetical protein
MIKSFAASERNLCQNEPIGRKMKESKKNKGEIRKPLAYCKCRPGEKLKAVFN